MRVIAGKARRLPLKTLEGLDTRPTTDRIKETLFNILQNDVPGARFLDLFAGSGGIGIEALSRGARAAVFVDNNKAAADCIRSNLTFTKMSDQGKVICSDVLSALSRLEGEDPFQIIFMDPPYSKGLEETVLRFWSEYQPSYIDENTLIIVEAKMGTDFSYLDSLGFDMIRVKEYKTNLHVFCRIKESQD